MKFFKFVFAFLSIFYCEFIYSQKVGIKDTIYITVCDTGSHGKMFFDLEKIKGSVYVNGPSSSNSPTVFISTQGGSVIKIENLLTTPTISNVCMNLGNSWPDIAINKEQEIYLNTFSAIYKLDKTNCTTQMFYNLLGSFLVALSFDTKNNLYYSSGSKIFRFNNSKGTPVEWHDFGFGTASGDFVMKNGKMYISWDNGSEVRLYEVTVDNNINFVSYVDKCSLKTSTFGLASELGVLYGVTPSELYKINESNCQQTTIKTNTSSSNWYGATGLHEAQNKITAHINYNNAVAISNEISGLWQNTIPYNQVIYLTLDDKAADSLFIYPVKIKINPKSFTTIQKTICLGTSYEGYSTPGTYTNIFRNINGCDSTRVLELKVITKLSDTIRPVICQGQNYKGHTISGTYFENYRTAGGCDSEVVIILKIAAPTSSTVNKTICEGKVFWGRSIAGTYTDILKNAQGCDSIRVLVLTVVKISKPIVDIRSCIIPGQSFQFYSQTISAPGVYIDSTNNIQECDTIYRLTVLQIIPKNELTKKTLCEGFNYNGVVIVKDTMLIDTVYSGMGCDSIYQLNDITVQKLIRTAPIKKYYCDTFQYLNNIFSRDSLIIDVIKYKKPPFCDSVRQKYFYVKAPKPTVKIYSSHGNYLVKGETITLEARGANKYLWSTFETNIRISHKPESSTRFAVIGWNEYNCKDTAELELEVEDSVYLDLPSAFSPNGDNNNDIWGPDASGKFEVLTLNIYNRWGEKVFSGSPLNFNWDGKYKEIPQPIGVYSYFISVKKNRSIYEKKGSVTIVK